MRFYFLLLTFLFLLSCKSKIEKTKPTKKTITESIYASGNVKSKNQYQAFASVNGIIDAIFVVEGDTVKAGSPLLSISSHTQKLTKENAELAAGFADANSNQGRVKAAKLLMELSLNKLNNDSIMYVRQKNLWQQKIGTLVELEQRKLAFQNSSSAYYSSVVNYNDIQKHVEFISTQAKKLLYISEANESEYLLRSEIDGTVYSIEKSKGEIVTVQTPVAVIGNSQHFILVMQVDEFDILKIKIGQNVIITMNSHKGKVFEARITKIAPLMNERSKTFLVEAMFKEKIPLLYPNISFEASIIVQTKNNALLIPRNYLLNDSTVLKTKGGNAKVKTGLMDYQMVEILSGLSLSDEIIKPTE